MTEELWLLKKRGLYYCPNDCGYTGIRDHAGRYTGEEARARLSPGIAMVRLDAAPEFSEACFDDLARDHLTKQRDSALAEVERLRHAFHTTHGALLCIAGTDSNWSKYARDVADEAGGMITTLIAEEGQRS